MARRLSNIVHNRQSILLLTVKTNSVNHPRCLSHSSSLVLAPPLVPSRSGGRANRAVISGPKSDACRGAQMIVVRPLFAGRSSCNFSGRGYGLRGGDPAPNPGLSNPWGASRRLAVPRIAQRGPLALRLEGLRQAGGGRPAHCSPLGSGRAAVRHLSTSSEAESRRSGLCAAPWAGPRRASKRRNQPGKAAAASLRMAAGGSAGISRTVRPRGAHTQPHPRTGAPGDSRSSFGARR